MGCCNSKPKAQSESEHELEYAATILTPDEVNAMVANGKPIYSAKRTYQSKKKGYLRYNTGDIIEVVSGNVNNSPKCKCINLSSNDEVEDPKGLLVYWACLEKVEIVETKPTEVKPMQSADPSSLARKPAAPPPRSGDSDVSEMAREQESEYEGDTSDSGQVGTSERRPLPNKPSMPLDGLGAPESISNKPGDRQSKIFVALYDFDEPSEGLLTFQKGDKFKELSENEGNWKKCKRQTDGEVGYVPMNFVASELAVRDSSFMTKTEEALGNEYEDIPTPLAARPSVISNLLKGGKGTKMVICDFKGGSTDASFSKGDIVESIKEIGDWSHVRNIKTNSLGFIPSNCIAAKEDNIHYEWYHGNLTRREALSRIVSANIRTGDYLVSKRSDFNDSLVLSLRSYDISKGPYVTEYPIHSSKGYHIKSDQVFQNLEAMIKHYQGKLIENPIKKQPPMLWDLSENFQNKVTIDENYLTYKDNVHEGKLVKVWRGNFNDTLLVCARVLKDGLLEKGTLENTCKQMKTLKHNNVLRIYGIVVESEPYSIITEWMENGDLLHYLRDGAGTDLDLLVLIDIATQIVCGMSYLEEHSFVHKDVAARNVMVDSNRRVKISLYGVSRLMEESIYATADESVQLPIRWAAPEAILKRQFGHKSDVWSYGITMVEIFTKGEIPYPEKLSNKQVLDSVRKGYRHSKPDGCPNQLYLIMQQCWQENPKERPEFSKIRNTMEYINEENSQKHVVFRETEEAPKERSTGTGENGADNLAFSDDELPVPARRKNVKFMEPEKDTASDTSPREVSSVSFQEVQDKVEVINCVECTARLVMPDTTFIMCSDCKKSWHKTCLPPEQINEEQLTEGSWKCTGCSAVFESIYVNAHIMNV